MSVRTWPDVSVVMPVRNEERHLRAAVAGVTSQAYEGRLEVVIAVGPSSDATWQIAQEIAGSDERITLVPNPTGATPAGLNLAIAAASADILIRVDGHGELAPGYIETAVTTLLDTGAANVGGLMDARGETPFEAAVAAAYTSRLGLGGASFHLPDSPAGPAQTVFLGCFRRDRLEAAGGFDETLLRGQDWELNHRLLAQGDLIWFTPTLRVTYRPRSSVRALARQFFTTGRWRREIVRRYPDTAGARYLAPPAAVLGVAGGTLAALVAPLTPRPWRTLLRAGGLAPLGYVGLLLLGSATQFRGLPAAVRVRLPLVLAVMHLCWGAGFLAGLPREQRSPS